MFTWFRNRRHAKLSGSQSLEWDQLAETVRSNKQARRQALAGQAAEVAWLENVLCESDPLGLVSLGAPVDEYRSEAETITLRRREASSRGDVQRIVHEEFVYWFDQQIAGPPGNYSQIAEVLWRRWNAMPSD